MSNPLSILIEFLNENSKPILTLTAVVTAYFASRSFQASKRQNELSTVPHLFFRIEGDFPNRELLIVNDNGKLAFNVKIDKLYVFNKSAKKRDWVVDKYELKPNNLGSAQKSNFLLEKNSKVALDIFVNNQKVDSNDRDFIAFLISERVIFKWPIWVIFTDSQNLKFFTSINFKKDGISYIKRAPTRFGLFWRVVWLYRITSTTITNLWHNLVIALHRSF